MTYSILARDSDSGAMGVAVQSHFLAVGACVPWGMAGVGVVATQATVGPRYGSQALRLMAAGVSAEMALESCINADDTPEVRQVGVLDARGRAAAHTGTRCWGSKAHAIRRNACTQANLVASAEVPMAMLDTFTETSGELGARLLAALAAAESSGGDVRGRQSAALLVVAGQRAEHSEDGILVDLRVDDHLDPLGELGRAYDRHRAWTAMLPVVRGPACRGRVAPSRRDLESAAAVLTAAQRTYGSENLEPTLWHAVALHRGGREDDAMRLLAQLRDANLGWVTMFEQVTAAVPAEA